VVIGDPCFVPRRTSRRLDTTHKAGPGKHAKRLVNPLQSEVPNSGSRDPGDLVGAGMIPRPDSIEDRQSRGSNSQSRSTQPVRISHARDLSA